MTTFWNCLKHKMLLLWKVFKAVLICAIPIIILLTFFPIIYYFIQNFNIVFKINTPASSFLVDTILYLITGLATLYLVGIAWIKLGKLSNDNQSKFLLQIDTRWSSPEIIKARTIIHHMYRDVNDIYSEAELKPELKEICKAVGKAITKMSESKFRSDRDNFMYLLNLLDFMETVGLLENEDYIEIGKLNALCGSTLMFFFDVFEDYIAYKRYKHRKEGFTLYENFEGLYRKLLKKKIQQIEFNSSNR